ncbi:MAG: hypothetical protein QOE92_2295 [Chloroflexota bacterium]|jgi:hypothetical protein|nr:hypothetical protein [Chloroflexota bacterium]
MRVTIRFLDGEIMEGQSDAATLSKMGFPVAFPEGNNQIAWVSLASIKYVLFRDTVLEQIEADNRGAQGMVKVVLHFVDGETMRTYKDDSFQQDGEGFNMRVYDPAVKGLIRAIVSLHALKAIFFVNEWDSRTDEERVRFGATTNGPAPSAAPPQPAPSDVEPATEPTTPPS